MQSRIDRLFCEVPKGVAVFISGYPNIFYYSGFCSPDAFLLLTPEKRLLITDSRYFTQAKEQSPYFEIVNIEKGWEHVFSLIVEKEICFEETNISFGLYKRITDSIKGKIFIASQTKIDRPRRIKDKEEIKIIAEAERIGDEAFDHILGFIQMGMSEREVALELEMYMRRLGASGLSFETIAASGVRSCMPHGAASDKIIEKGDFLTLDFGCVYKGYCSDMTRTVVMGEADSRQKEVYETVLAAQLAALDGLHMGISCSDADKIARDVIAQAGFDGKFTHALGHSVGIEIHEKPIFSPKSTDILQEGHVLSVEPGIYIEGWGGVRIEDLIAVSDGKIVNLSNSPKKLLVL